MAEFSNEVFAFIFVYFLMMNELWLLFNNLRSCTILLAICWWKNCKILTFCCCDLFSLRFGRVNLLLCVFLCMFRLWRMACWEEKALPEMESTENTGKNLLHRGKRLSLINSLIELFLHHFQLLRVLTQCVANSCFFLFYLL